MTESLIEYLRSQPDEFVIDWYVDNMNSEKPWETAWVDVIFEDQMAWVITSGLLDDDDNDLTWPPDMIGHCLIDPDVLEPVAGIKPVPLGRPATEEDLVEIRWAMGVVGPNAYWMGTPCWSATEINRAIEDWCIREVGRPLQAHWNAEHGPSPFLANAIETAQRIKDGIEPTYMLYPGENEGGEGFTVYASEQVMEMLAQAELLDGDE